MRRKEALAILDAEIAARSQHIHALADGTDTVLAQLDLVVANLNALLLQSKKGNNDRSGY